MKTSTKIMVFAGISLVLTGLLGCAGNVYPYRDGSPYGYRGHGVYSQPYYGYGGHGSSRYGYSEHHHFHRDRNRDGYSGRNRDRDGD